MTSRGMTNISLGPKGFPIKLKFPGPESAVVLEVGSDGLLKGDLRAAQKRLAEMSDNNISFAEIVIAIAIGRQLKDEGGE